MNVNPVAAGLLSSVGDCLCLRDVFLAICTQASAMKTAQRSTIQSDIQ